MALSWAEHELLRAVALSPDAVHEPPVTALPSHHSSGHKPPGHGPNGERAADSHPGLSPSRDTSSHCKDIFCALLSSEHCQLREGGQPGAQTLGMKVTTVSWRAGKAGGMVGVDEDVSS